MGKISIKTRETNNAMVYEITNGIHKVEVSCFDDNTLRVQGDKKILSEAIAGRGEENSTEAWFDDTDLKSSSEAVSNVLEVITVLLKKSE
jgi:hypothetical protein